MEHRSDAVLESASSADDISSKKKLAFMLMCPQQLTTDLWYHTAVTFRKGIFTLYVNGVVCASKAITAPCYRATFLHGCMKSKVPAPLACRGLDGNACLKSPTNSLLGEKEQLQVGQSWNRYF
jgi:hypothetical protein